MDFEEKKKKLLDQLNKATGINFDITDSDLSDDETLNKLKELVVHFNVIDSKTGLYRLFLSKELAYSDALSSLSRFHIDEEHLRQIFYLESPGEYSKEAVSLLKSLLPDSKDVVLELDSKHLVLIINFDVAPSSEDILQTASSYLDMLETEAFTSFKLSYSKSVMSFKELPNAYNDAITAMEIGNTFNSNGRIYCYEDLGLGRLLYNVPPAEIKAYLNKHINVDILSQIDEETLSLINAFFENDLSLAETARQTFIHRNTLIYRLDKFADLTGYDVRKFNEAITVKISLMLFNYIKAQ
ncbi:helix-turn-helix domain-containing protein [Butyrivibrio fibrisolvens]|uniref:PucR family transcriptional regulator n=1 Tax=Pseudobutyrivibrio ruminis TaxID=46206 RepID=UPI000423D8E2|nr:helix-turn-helix domain-containing protein [Pseudobutyrivibrio ruminis]MDC7279287.1 helix-turn-helix domain-containing protein [Butyrivibrio fibrisolvens]